MSPKSSRMSDRSDGYATKNKTNKRYDNDAMNSSSLAGGKNINGRRSDVGSKRSTKSNNLEQTPNVDNRSGSVERGSTRTKSINSKSRSAVSRKEIAENGNSEQETNIPSKRSSSKFSSFSYEREPVRRSRSDINKSEKPPKTVNSPSNLEDENTKRSAVRVGHSCVYFTISNHESKGNSPSQESLHSGNEDRDTHEEQVGKGKRPSQEKLQSGKQNWKAANNLRQRKGVQENQGDSDVEELDGRKTGVYRNTKFGKKNENVDPSMKENDHNMSDYSGDAESNKNGRNKYYLKEDGSYEGYETNEGNEEQVGNGNNPSQERSPSGNQDRKTHEAQVGKGKHPSQEKLQSGNQNRRTRNAEVNTGPAKCNTRSASANNLRQRKGVQKNQCDSDVEELDGRKTCVYQNTKLAKKLDYCDSSMKENAHNMPDYCGDAESKKNGPNKCYLKQDGSYERYETSDIKRPEKPTCGVTKHSRNRRKSNKEKCKNTKCLKRREKEAKDKRKEEEAEKKNITIIIKCDHGAKSSKKKKKKSKKPRKKCERRQNRSESQTSKMRCQSKSRDTDCQKRDCDLHCKESDSYECGGRSSKCKEEGYETKKRTSSRSEQNGKSQRNKRQPGGQQKGKEKGKEKGNRKKRGGPCSCLQKQTSTDVSEDEGGNQPRSRSQSTKRRRKRSKSGDKRRRRSSKSNRRRNCVSSESDDEQDKPCSKSCTSKSQIERKAPKCKKSCQGIEKKKPPSSQICVRIPPPCIKEVSNNCPALPTTCSSAQAKAKEAARARSQCEAPCSQDRMKDVLQSALKQAACGATINIR